VTVLPPLASHPLAYDKPLCASLDGFTLHAATHAGAHDLAGREALLRYVLRPPIAQERLEQRPNGLVRITLKKVLTGWTRHGRAHPLFARSRSLRELRRAFGDGTVAVDMDPLSLLCRLATSVPPPRFHTVRYAGVLAAASPSRPDIAPKPPPQQPVPATAKPTERGPLAGTARGRNSWRAPLPWTFSPVPPARDATGCPW